MSVEALWTVEIPDAKGGWINGGVVVLETGRIFGGDSFYYFLGSYDVCGGSVSGTLNVTHYNGPQSTTWGDYAAKLSVKFNMKVEETVATGTGERLDKPGMRLPIRLTKRADLP